MRLGLGLGLNRSGGSGYYILLGGVAGGSFDETTGAIGEIGTATTNLTGSLTWSILGGGDADISINSSTGAVSSARAIYVGDSASFTVTVSNGVLTLGMPFEAVGTVAEPALMLDNLTATPTAALSMRKLITAYAGSCIRVRRLADNVEQDIGFSATPDGNGDYWVDAAAVASFAPAGAAITTIYDQTGNSRPATMTTTTRQPLFNATGWASSKPAAVFDGTDDYMTIPDHRGSFTDELGLVAVGNNASTSRNLFNPQQTSGDNSGSNSLNFNASSKFLFTSDPTTGGRPQPISSASLTSTNLSVVASYDSTGGATMHVNGESLSAAAGSGNLSWGATTTYSWTLGAYQPSLGTYWNGPIVELVIFNDKIDSTDRTAIRASHTAAYGAP